MIIACALSFVWFLQSKQTKAAQDLSIDMAVTRIKNKEFKEALFKQSSVEFTDQNGNKFVTRIGSDPTRELLVNSVNKFNDENSASQIATNEEESSSGLGWLVLIQVLPLLLI